ncbi:MAG: phage minor head protein [Acidobacteriota bacterium]|nr:phage minor head protein [Acidobacteriota bacterium]
MKDPVHVIADRLAPQVRAQFLAAVKVLRERRISLDALADAVARGGVSVRLDEALAAWPEDLRGAVAIINQVFAQAGEQAEQELQQRFRVQARFDVVNPRAVDAAARYTATLVREVTDQTQQAIRSVISSAISNGMAPREAAHLIRSVVGLTSRQGMAVVNYRSSLIDAGASADQVAKAADRYAAKLLRQRALTIARTETIRAGNLGRQTTWQEAREAGYLPDGASKRWVVTEDDRLCPVCEPLDGEETTLDGLFSTPVGTFSGPPLHPNCRCTTTLVIPRPARSAAAA